MPLPRGAKPQSILPAFTQGLLPMIANAARGSVAATVGAPGDIAGLLGMQTSLPTSQGLLGAIPAVGDAKAADTWATVGGFLPTPVPLKPVAKAANLASDAAVRAITGNKAANALNVLDYAGKMNPLSKIFIGEGAKTWDKNAADAFLNLEKSGVSNKDAYLQTGTFRSPDGKLRQEIDDSTAKFDNPFPKATEEQTRRAVEAIKTIADVKAQQKPLREAGTFNLEEFYRSRPGLYEQYRAANDYVNKYNRDFSDPKVKSGYFADFIDHPDLYKAYPKTSVIPTTYNQNQSGGNYMPNLNTILFGLGNEKSVALHEIQHAIQNAEGLAMGGSPDEIAGLLRNREFLQQKQSNSMAQMKRALDNNGIDPNTGLTLEQIGIQASETGKKLQGLRNIPDDPFEAYKNLAGEAEARAVQARINMTPEQRRTSFPLDSYDVPINELIFRALLDTSKAL